MNTFENINWQFEELVKTLIIMTLPLVEQKEAYGIGILADEMLEDFYTFYTLNKTRLQQSKLIKKEAIMLLNEIDSLTDKWSDEKEEAFFLDMEQYDQEWDSLRELAGDALNQLGMKGAGIKVKHENEVNDKGQIIVQKTKIELNHIGLRGITKK